MALFQNVTQGLHVLMIGTGEYTVGLIPPQNSGGSSSKSDKKLGVVALTMFDLRRRGLVKWLGLCGTSYKKTKQAEQWLQQGLGETYKLNVALDKTFPERESSDRDPKAYEKAIDALPPFSCVTIFTPDSTHFAIALYAIRHQCHVMLAKPSVLSTEHHQQLVKEANEQNVLVCIEYHKRFDPIYADARDVMRKDFGFVNYMNAYMSQPKYQLETFKSWAGISSDISFYLNSHHIDFLLWATEGRSKPVRVTAMASKGIANREPYKCHENTEDTITLMVQLENQDGSTGTAVFTSSWTAPNLSEVHSQQRFQCLGSKTEVRVDQAHRGYELTTDLKGYSSRNPLFMKYAPDDQGRFVGQNGYGYKSFEVWLRACHDINTKIMTLTDILEKKLHVPSEYSASLATIQATFNVTAILEAGRKSLDAVKYFGAFALALSLISLIVAQEFEPTPSIEVVGSNTEYMLSVKYDKNGNAYLTGFTNSPTISVRDPITNVSINVPNNGTSNSFYLVKVSPTGQPLWGTKMTTGTNWPLLTTEIDDNENVYVASSFIRDVHFFSSDNTYATTLSGNNTNNGFLVSFNASGSFQWATMSSGSSSVIQTSVTLDTNGLLVSGYSSSNFISIRGSDGIALPPIVKSGNYHGYVAKFSFHGQALWVNQQIAAENHNSHGVYTRSVHATDDALFICGRFTSTGMNSTFPNGTIGFSTRVRSSITQSSFVAKMTKDGEVLWTAVVENIQSGGEYPYCFINKNDQTPSVVFQTSSVPVTVFSAADINSTVYQFQSGYNTGVVKFQPDGSFDFLVSAEIPSSVHYTFTTASDSAGFTLLHVGVLNPNNYQVREANGTVSSVPAISSQTWATLVSRFSYDGVFQGMRQIGFGNQLAIGRAIGSSDNNILACTETRNTLSVFNSTNNIAFNVTMQSSNYDVLCVLYPIRPVVGVSQTTTPASVSTSTIAAASVSTSTIAASDPTSVNSAPNSVVTSTVVVENVAPTSVVGPVSTSVKNQVPTEEAEEAGSGGVAAGAAIGTLLITGAIGATAYYARRRRSASQKQETYMTETAAGAETTQIPNDVSTSLRKEATL